MTPEVRVVSYETREEPGLGPVHVASFSDGRHTVEMRMLAHLVPRAAFECVMHETAGALRSLSERRNRRPQVGQRIVAPNIEGRTFITQVDHSTPVPRVWVYASVPVVHSHDAVEVDWAKCLYPDEIAG